MGPHVEVLHLREDPQVPGTGCGGGFALSGPGEGPAWFGGSGGNRDEK